MLGSILARLQHLSDRLEQLPASQRDIVRGLIGVGLAAIFAWLLRAFGRVLFDRLILRRRAKIRPTGTWHPRKHTTADSTYIIFQRVEISAPRSRPITVGAYLRFKERVTNDWINDWDCQPVSVDVPKWDQAKANFSQGGLLKFPINLGAGESVSGYMGFRIWDGSSPLPESRNEAWLVFTEKRSGVRLSRRHLKLVPILPSTI